MFLKNLNKYSYLYIANVQNIDIEKALTIVPEIRKQKALNLSLEKDQKLSLGAYLLLIKALKLHHFDALKYEFYYNEKGKPELKGLPINFSISHSGNYVAIALSKDPIGVDIQEIREIDDKLIGYVLNDAEISLINKDNKLNSFFEIWTAKEAYLKYIGIGLEKTLKSIDITNKKSLLKHIDAINGYKICVCKSEKMLKYKLFNLSCD